ncbi:MAG: nitrite reductase small subunit NirD [Psychrosphaera sp.]|nr:nitrite reductase small subunit NirD [Psychrosphaera sp.]
MTYKSKSNWTNICRLSDIPPLSGVCALHQGEQVAIFNLGVADDSGKTVKSITNIDPIADASVLSRGLIGDIDGRLVVASPLNKRHFCLDTGECLQDPSCKVAVYAVRVHGDMVQLKG